MTYYYVYKSMPDGIKWLKAVFVEEKDAKNYAKVDKNLTIKIRDSLPS